MLPAMSSRMLRRGLLVLAFCCSLLWLGQEPMAMSQQPTRSSRRATLLRPQAEKLSHRPSQEQSVLVTTRQPAGEAAGPQLLPPRVAPMPATEEALPRPEPEVDQRQRVDGIDISVQPLGEVDIAGATRPPGMLTPKNYAGELVERGPVLEPQYALLAPHRLPPVPGTFCFRPLYFEEANLERYGNRLGCVQPLVSAARFYAALPAWPYLMSANPPQGCEASRYRYQAGRPAPWVSERPPLSVRGGLIEAGLAVGLMYLLP